jgi:hypothetical protein
MIHGALRGCGGRGGENPVSTEVQSRKYREVGQIPTEFLSKNMRLHMHERRGIRMCIRATWLAAMPTRFKELDDA